MASVAIDRRVSSRQREAIVVLLNVLDGNLPATNRMALFAIRAHLALMNVGMAVLAALPDVGEDHLYVTRRTGHGTMHTAQRIVRLIVVELGNRTDRLPAIRRVTVLTRHRETAVRTTSSFGDLSSRASRECGKCNREDDESC